MTLSIDGHVVVAMTTHVTGASSGFRHWGSGQPGGIWGSIDDCAVMKLDGFWYDYACDVFFEHFGYICQYGESALCVCVCVLAWAGVICAGCCHT